MAIELNHTIVPVRDKAESARFYETHLRVRAPGAAGAFPADPHHLPGPVAGISTTARRSSTTTNAFKVSEPEFDEIFGRIREAGLEYGSGPRSSTDMKTNTWNGGRGVYFRDSLTATCWSCLRKTTPDGRRPSTSLRYAQGERGISNPLRPRGLGQRGVVRADGDVDEGGRRQQDQAHDLKDAVVAAVHVEVDAGQEGSSGGADLVHEEAQAHDESRESRPHHLEEHDVLNPDGAEGRPHGQRHHDVEGQRVRESRRTWRGCPGREKRT